MTDLPLPLNILGVTSEGEVAWCWGAEALDSSNVIYANESELRELIKEVEHGGPLYPPQQCARHNDRDAVAFTGHGDPACRECYYGTGYDKEAS